MSCPPVQPSRSDASGPAEKWRRHGLVFKLYDSEHEQQVRVGAATIYFAAWLSLLILLKVLVLEEYHIRFRGLSTVVVGALVLAKVVLVLEHVPQRATAKHGRSGY